MQSFEHSGKVDLMLDIQDYIKDELLIGEGSTKTESNNDKLALNRTLYSDSKLSKGTIKSHV